VQGKEAIGKEEEITIYSAASIEREHEVILHMLDRELPPDIPGKDLPRYYPASAFESTVDSWVGVPVVFHRGAEHVDIDAFSADPVAECNRIGARIVGEITRSWIDRHGRAKLMGLMNIRDAEVEKLFNEGKLSPSTGLKASGIRDSVRTTLTGNVRPNHLLLFEESAATGALPRDLGAQILNKVRPCQVQQKNGAIMPNQPPAAPAAPTGGIAPGVLDRLKSLFSEALQILEGKEVTPEETPVVSSKKDDTPPVTTLTNALTSEDDKMNAELEAKVGSLTTENETLKATNAKLEADAKLLKERVDAIETAEKEQKWNNVKQSLEVGRIDTPEKLAAERASFEKDAVSFMMPLVNSKKADAKKEGETVVDVFTNTHKEAGDRMTRPKIQGRSR
jgi:hypothetical protein